MAERTEIAWCDSTFNPWIGFSTAAGGGGGCDGCYAEVSTPARVLRARGAETWGPGAPRQRTSAANWRQPIAWNAREFLRCTCCPWRGEERAWRENMGNCPGCGRGEVCDTMLRTRRRVFCASLADVFDNEVDPAWRADLFALIAATPNLDWLLLTKRIGNAAKMIDEASSRPGWPFWPWPNVWLMATMVNQPEYDRDIGKLLRTPAAVHGISVEPMLGAMDLRLGGASMPDYADARPLARLDWIIAGGESGPGARPAHPDWFRSLRDQCVAAGVAYIFKQWGEWAPAPIEAYPRDPLGEKRWVSRDGTVMPTINGIAVSATGMQRVGKKAAGRLLDGIEHNGFPEVRHG